jgi:hypothetical protein
LHELERAGLYELQKTWKDIAMQGFCTMSPEVCRWVLKSADAEIASATANHLLTLDRMVNFLLPSEDAKLLAQRHRAGADAALAFQVFLVLLKRGTVKVG